MWKDNILLGCEKSLRDENFYKEFSESIQNLKSERAVELINKVLKLCEESVDQKKIIANLWFNVKSNYIAVNDHPQVSGIDKGITE